jgi:hypothetical protein
MILQREPSMLLYDRHYQLRELLGRGDFGEAHPRPAGEGRERRSVLCTWKAEAACVRSRGARQPA